MTAVQRFPARAEQNRDWHGTRIMLPGDAPGGVDVFTGRAVKGGEIDAEHLFETLPVAVLAPPRSDGKA